MNGEQEAGRRLSFELLQWASPLDEVHSELLVFDFYVVQASYGFFGSALAHRDKGLGFHHLIQNM
jgi:hypothetical protein